MAELVLIVDDNGRDRDAMARLMQNAGFEVTTAVDGRDGLRVLDTVRPALIVLDMVMPSGFDGWFFLGQRKHHAADDIPVLIVTGLNIANEVWATGLGASGFLKKPMDADRLIAEVRKLVHV